MNPHGFRLKPLGIDTLREYVIYMRCDCHVCRAEGFKAQTHQPAVACESSCQSGPARSNSRCRPGRRIEKSAEPTTVRNPYHEPALAPESDI